MTELPGPRLSDSSHPKGSGICHHVLSVNVQLQCRILDFANGTTLRQLLSLLQHLESELERCFFRGLKIQNLFVAKSGLWSGCSRHSHPHCCNKAAICQATWGIGVKWLSSFSTSEEASWCSQIIIWLGSSKSCLSVVLFTMPRILCWRHSYNHNTM